MRNGFLGSLIALLAGMPVLAADPALPVTLGRPVPLNEAVHLQGPVVTDADPTILRTTALEDNSAPPAIYRAQAAAPIDPLFPPPGPPGGPVPGPPVTGGPVPACPAACPSENNRVWLDGELLLWWVRNGPSPVGSSADFGLFTGLKLDAGVWLDPSAKWGIEGSFLLLSRKSTQLGAPAAGAIPLPDLLAVGGAAANVDTQLWGFEFNGLYSLYRDSNFHADLIGGFRYLGLQEDLKGYANGTLFLPNGEIENGTAMDRLTAQNNFYGAQIGARAGWRFNRFFVDATGKIAFGLTQEGLTLQDVATGIDGATDAFQMRHSTTDFAVVPEFNLRVGYNITRNIRAFVGYDFLYISSVARPGNQDLFGLSSVKTTGFWAQGLDFGVEITF
jgi:hypothetical protein